MTNCPKCNNAVKTRIESIVEYYGDERVVFDAPIRYCGHCRMEYTDEEYEAAEEKAVREQTSIPRS